MIPNWIAFDKTATNLPKERRYCLVITAEQPDKGTPSGVAVGYIRIWSDGPWWVIPGIGGTVTHYADCLGDDFATPVLMNHHGNRWQLTNGKWGEEPRTTLEEFKAHEV